MEGSFRRKDNDRLHHGRKRGYLNAARWCRQRSLHVDKPLEKLLSHWRNAPVMATSYEVKGSAKGELRLT